jgi:hypothetical protein
MILITVVVKVGVDVIFLIMYKSVYFVREERLFKLMYVEAMWIFKESYLQRKMKWL